MGSVNVGCGRVSALQCECSYTERQRREILVNAHWGRRQRTVIHVREATCESCAILFRSGRMDERLPPLASTPTSLMACGSGAGGRSWRKTPTHPLPSQILPTGEVEHAGEWD